MKDDLISRQAALDMVEENMRNNPHKNTVHRAMHDHEHRHFLLMLMGMPSAQPEIVRCKDCKFYTEIRTDLKTGICSLACRHLGDDGFCSEAERRSDG